MTPVSGTTMCDHNCIPVSRWGRARWVCVRCNQLFKMPPPSSWKPLSPAEQDRAKRLRDVT